MCCGSFFNILNRARASVFAGIFWAYDEDACFLESRSTLIIKGVTVAGLANGVILLAGAWGGALVLGVLKKMLFLRWYSRFFFLIFLFFFTRALFVFLGYCDVLMEGKTNVYLMVHVYTYTYLYVRTRARIKNVLFITYAYYATCGAPPPGIFCKWKTKCG